MPQQEFVPQTYTLQGSPTSNSPSVHLRSEQKEGNVDFTFEAIKPGLFRTTFSSESHPLPPFPSASKPQTIPSAFSIIAGRYSRTFHASGIEAKIAWDNAPIVSVGFLGEEPMHTDLPLRSYVLDGPGIAQYTRYFRNSLHVGLGEKAAPFDLSGRHFTLSATDCFGYDVHRTDPMYKHIPLLIRATPDGVVATFTTSHARGYYSVGSEMYVIRSMLGKCGRLRMCLQNCPDFFTP